MTALRGSLLALLVFHGFGPPLVECFDFMGRDTSTETFEIWVWTSIVNVDFESAIKSGRTEDWS